MPSDIPAIFWAPLLFPPGWLGLVCLFIYIDIKTGYPLNWFLIQNGAGLAIGGPVACYCASMLTLYMQKTFLFTYWFVMMGLVWAFLAFQGLNHADDPKGKALVVFSILWTFLIPLPPALLWQWSTAQALLPVFVLAGLGYIVLDILVKHRSGAKARKEAFYEHVMQEIDAAEPPWERETQYQLGQSEQREAEARSDKPFAPEKRTGTLERSLMRWFRVGIVTIILCFLISQLIWHGWLPFGEWRLLMGTIIASTMAAIFIVFAIKGGYPDKRAFALDVAFLLFLVLSVVLCSTLDWPNTRQIQLLAWLSFAWISIRLILSLVKTGRPQQKKHNSKDRRF